MLKETETETETASVNPAVLVVGASGGIGAAALDRYLGDSAYARVFAVSRGPQPARLASFDSRLEWLTSDYSEASVAGIAEQITQGGFELRRVIICNGILHSPRLSPEKSLDKVGREAMHEVFDANVVVPSLWVSNLAGHLRRSTGCVIAVLSARVGSISDNRLGGWYSYRSSKAALNMFLKTASIEYARRAPRVKLVAFHPGTTDTALSQPFQSGVPEGKLFSPTFVAERLCTQLDTMQADGELSFVDWDARPVPW
jgi:NAD(P)-dependent dehydrogenase (short-subunit alcohol dehydrogenase family)